MCVDLYKVLESLRISEDGSMTTPERFDLWSWPKRKDEVRTLPGRLGFPEGNTLQVLGFEMSLADGSVFDKIKNQQLEVAPDFLLFLLAFYSKAKAIPLTGQLISYRQIPGGRVYDPVFEGRAVGPIARKLGDKPDSFTRAAEALSGTRIENGDIGYVIPTLPFTPLTYVLWLGDEEFPARAQILMDGSMENYLDAEAVSHLAEVTSRRLVSIALR
jgi:hypothetical protein